MTEWIAEDYLPNDTKEILQLKRKKGNIMMVKVLVVMLAMLGTLLTYTSLENMVGYVGPLWIISLLMGWTMIIFSLWRIKNDR